MAFRRFWAKERPVIQKLFLPKVLPLSQHASLVAVAIAVGYDIVEQGSYCEPPMGVRTCSIVVVYTYQNPATNTFLLCTGPVNQHDKIDRTVESTSALPNLNALAFITRVVSSLLISRPLTPTPRRLPTLRRPFLL